MIKDPVQIEKIIQDVFASPKTVSVIINTRNRIIELKETIDSLFANASHPENVEVLIRVDDDDEDTISKLHILPVGVKSIIGKRNGYKYAHDGYMEMTRQATGEFVMAFADDFYLSKNWDDYIQMHRGQICVIYTSRELVFITHRAIPLVWERFGIAFSVDVHYKIIGLELKAYVRHDEIQLTHDHRGATREYVTDLTDYMWVNDKPLIYEMTDALKPYVHPELFVNYTPLTGICNSWAHPINDYARGKIYWWPIAVETDPSYWRIKGARDWFHPQSNYRDDWIMEKNPIEIEPIKLTNEQFVSQIQVSGVIPSIG